METEMATATPMETEMATATEIATAIDLKEEEENHGGKRSRVEQTHVIDDYDLTNSGDCLSSYLSRKKTLFIFTNSAAGGDGGGCCIREIEIQEVLKRCKMIGLLFLPPYLPQLPSCVSFFYRSMKRKHLDSFEMIFVPCPVARPRKVAATANFFYEFLRHVPFPAVHVHDSVWRDHLCGLSLLSRPRCFDPDRVSDISFVDTTRFPFRFESCALGDLFHYGPHLYPFTTDRHLLVSQRFSDLATKLSIKDILAAVGDKNICGSDFLIDRQGRRVPVSDLEDKDVALCAFSPSYERSDKFIQQLLHVYNNTSRDKFEVVFVNMQHDSGYQDRTSFNKALSSMPWLALPFDDDRVWNLHHMMFCGHYDAYFYPRGRDTRLDLTEDSPYWGDFPIMFIKPAGNQSPVDPYGYMVLHELGPEYCPFTRERALSMTMDKLKSLTWDSFAHAARGLGLDFNSLLVKDDDTVKNVLISDIFPNKDRPMLLLFAMPGQLSQGRLQSLINVYNEARLKSNSSFEVIFVPMVGDFQKEMPWYAVKTPLSIVEHIRLLKATIGFDIWNVFSHFMAFGKDGKLLRVGVATSFDDCEFPFMHDEGEYKERVYALLLRSIGCKCKESNPPGPSTLFETWADPDLDGDEEDDGEDEEDDGEDDEEDDGEDEE